MWRTRATVRFGFAAMIGLLALLLLAGYSSSALAQEGRSDTARSAKVEGARAFGLDFVGNVSYSFIGNTARLKADQIRNSRSSGTSGSLRMVLYFTTVPFMQATTAYFTAIYNLNPGTLAAGFSFFNVDSGLISFASPPDGTYYVSMTLEEFQVSGQYNYYDLVQFSNLVTLGVVCNANATTLCLQNNRFRVTVNWSVPSQGTSGVGSVVPLTGDTGAVYFFSPNNYEMMLKVVDGNAVNGRFWFFGGMLTNVSFTITIVDTVTGAVRTYSSVQGSVAIFQDTNAFLGP
jgi:hypothetical protein